MMASAQAWLAATHAAGDDDLLDIHEDDEAHDAAPTSRPWTVLVVDDDRGVHEATVLALRGTRLQGRALSFLHAYSATEAARTVAEHADIALILLDVVMETEDAGLKLVGVIRDQLGRRDVRILIRTGQPGYFPEAEVKRDYAIDGYLLKAQMTGAQLKDAVTAALGR